MDIQEIRNKAKRLLESGEVKVVVGYERGSTESKSTPAFIESPDDVDRLIWDATCVNNLAAYAIQEAKNGGVAIIARDCDARSIVMLVQEHQLDKDAVRVIEVPDETQWADDPALPESLEERRAFWAKEFEKCTRCYACRQACPGCFCNTCFIDRIVPRWAAKRAGASDAWMFHVTRAMHQAGRCGDCRECSRVCPVGIPVHLLAREIETFVGELFDYKAGMDMDADPVLGTFTPEDPDPNEHGG
ncbi:MAG: 4Fe-4S dicluster domain-containing protein [Armatimonadota bacterium]|nr:4Fe-4S dicluster domain-containing protein [Armatimonadota bacterium]